MMADFWDTFAATWPPAAQQVHKGWCLRDGAGGGKRVSATTRLTPGADVADVATSPLFMVRAGQDDDLDHVLAAQGYTVMDPTIVYTIDIAALTDVPLAIAQSYAVWPPLHAITEIWGAGDIGPGRAAVMQRVTAPKAAILSRVADFPAGAGFVAVHGTTAMIHAMTVLPDHRRNGCAERIVRHAAHWAQGQGAHTMALAVTRANTAANALYHKLGFQPLGQYHYRARPDTE
ncbi:MAG: GNAT family N-acetyltransferase [Pseudomonadota bacterium]